MTLYSLIFIFAPLALGHLYSTVSQNLSKNLFLLSPHNNDGDDATVACYCYKLIPLAFSIL